MSYYWLYSRLDLHVGTSEANVRTALAEYADAHLKGAREVLTEEHYGAILSEHADAGSLYATVMGGA